jgi:hypothetical protein
MEIVTTSVTNYDIHDIARVARTYSVKKYFIIHPHDSQAKLVQDVIDYWRTGYGAQVHADRKEAFSVLELKKNIAEAKQAIMEREGKPPIIVTTDARIYENTISYKELREKLAVSELPYLILFGTGWGIEKDTMKEFDYILEPVYGAGDYNHLPVRSAVSIILDRLCGEKWW